MTQKEKLIKAFIALQSIKSGVMNLEKEADSYNLRFHKSYTSSIIKKCDETLKLLK